MVKRGRAGEYSRDGRARRLTAIQALTEPYSYITGYPGKEIRSKMIEAFNLWLNVPQEKLSVISKVVSMLHSASLL